MTDYLASITPWLVSLRTWIMWVAEKIAGAFELEINNVFFVLVLILSYWLGKKIFSIFYSTTEGRMGILLIIVGIIFYVIKYLGL